LEAVPEQASTIGLERCSSRENGYRDDVEVNPKSLANVGFAPVATSTGNASGKSFGTQIGVDRYVPKPTAR